MNKSGAYKKKEKNIKSIEARLSLLERGIKNPKKFAGILSSLASQRSLSALTFETHNIFPMSLTTMKTLANSIFKSHASSGQSGFEYFDNKRIQLARAIEELTVTKNSEKNQLSAYTKIDELEEKLSRTEYQNLLRARAYSSLFLKLKLLVKSEELGDIAKLRIHALLAEHTALYDSLLLPPPDPSRGIERRRGTSLSKTLSVVRGGRE